MHQVRGVRAALGHLAARGHHFLVLFGLGVEDPGLVELLARLERAAVAADEVDLAVHEGRSVPAARRRTRALLGRLEVVEVVVGSGQEVELLLLVQRQRPGVLRELLVFSGEAEDVRRHVAVEHVKEPAVYLNRFFALRCADGTRGVLEPRREVGALRQEVGVLLAVFVVRVWHRPHTRPAEVVLAAAEFQEPDLVCCLALFCLRVVQVAPDHEPFRLVA